MSRILFVADAEDDTISLFREEEGANYHAAHELFVNKHFHDIESLEGLGLSPDMKEALEALIWSCSSNCTIILEEATEYDRDALMVARGKEPAARH